MKGKGFGKLVEVNCLKQKSYSICFGFLLLLSLLLEFADYFLINLFRLEKRFELDFESLGLIIRRRFL